jgi:uncharacterized protein YlaI
MKISETCAKKTHVYVAAICPICQEVTFVNDSSSNRSSLVIDATKTYVCPLCGTHMATKVITETTTQTYEIKEQTNENK